MMSKLRNVIMVFFDNQIIDILVMWISYGLKDAVIIKPNSSRIGNEGTVHLSQLKTEFSNKSAFRALNLSLSMFMKLGQIKTL